MPETQTYQGHCHCGAVQFTVDADLSSVVDCNCSHCEQKGLLLSFAPATAFQLTAGEDALKEYRFNKKQIGHRFCSVCGVQPFAFGAMPDGTQIRAINVRCLEGVDLASLNRRHVDGRSA